MSRYNHPHELKNRTIILHILGGLLCVVLLTIICPHEASTKLDFKQGEPWDKEALIARDSFEVFKSEAEIEKERDSLKSLYQPYYNVQRDVEQNMLKRFKAELDSLTKGEPAKRNVVNIMVRDLADHFKAGIVEDEAFESMQDNGVLFIHKYSHPTDTVCALESIYTVKATLEDLMEHSDNVRGILQRTRLTQYLEPNLKYNEELSEIQRDEVNKFATICSGRVMIGEKIVDRGQIIDQATFDKLTSYVSALQKRGRTANERYSQIGGNALYILLWVLALYFFFFQFRSDYLHTKKCVRLVYILFLIFPALAYALANNDFLSIYIVPYCMVPIFLRVFLDSRTAFITHLAIIMLCALGTNHPFEFISTQILAGLAAIYSLKQLQQRSELFTTVLFVTGISLLVNLCMDLIQMNFFSNGGFKWDVYVHICINGVLLFISYLLLFPIEKALGFTSMVTLVELSNINHPALRRLSEEAPGTFQHSMQVANLAAAVANVLGAKSQLVRTGALYHDLGKLKDPIYFTENQAGHNPHQNLSFEDSAQKIIQHVQYGLKLANDYALPLDIKELIATHHGRSKTKFFYVSYCNAHPEQKVNEEIFTYPGPNPTTVEQAILMMADAVEAASRSLTEYTEESISNLVEKIVNAQVQEGYFNQCDITYANIDRAKHTFKEKLKSMYHTRIIYPELKNKEG